MRRSLCLLLGLLITAGCQPVVTPRTPTTTKKVTPKSPSPSDNGGPVIAPASQPPLLAQDPVRVIDPTATDLMGKVHLIGKVKLISDKGLGILSNNSGSLIGNNGGGLISDKGLGIITNGGGNYRTLQTGGTSAVPEAWLAEAKVEVLDAAGNLLVDTDNKPLAVTSDIEGTYRLEATLPKENLVLRTRLFNGGTLYSFLTNTVPDPNPRRQDVDTASSLGAVYVLDKYVGKKQAVLNLLPKVEADNLQRDMEAARALLGAVPPSYTRDALFKAAEELKAKDTALKTTLERIEAILIAGQKNLGEGLEATKVALGLPFALCMGSDDSMVIAEWAGGRLRQVSKDGLIRTIAGTGAPNSPVEARSWGPVSDIVRLPDGRFIMATPLSGKVWSIAADGKVEAIAGTGANGAGSVNVTAKGAKLNYPYSLALGADGTLYIGEYPMQGGVDRIPGRILKIGPDGILKQVPSSPQLAGRAEFTGLAMTPDGALWAAEDDSGFLMKLPAGSETWQTMEFGLHNGPKRLTAGTDGAVYAAESYGHRVVKVDAAGQFKVVAGTGAAGYSDGLATTAMLNEPAGLLIAPDGRLVITDAGNGLVRMLESDGTLKTIAGTRSIVQQGDALQISINSPSGATIDPQGRLVIAETAGSTLKRLDGGTLTALAGGGKGFGGDGGPALAAFFDYPAGVTYHNGDLYFCDSGNSRIRKIDQSGIVTTVVGKPVGAFAIITQGGSPALETGLGRPGMLAFSPDGVLHFTDYVNHLVLRVSKAGLVEIVAGTPSATGAHPTGGDGGDGGPATQAKLSRPLGLTFDKAGNLYIADTGNLRVRKVAPDGTITTFAGMSLAKTFPALAGGQPPAAGAKADAVALPVPSGIAFDADGNLFISCLGTENLGFLGDIQGLSPDLVPKVPASILKVKADGTAVVVAGRGGKALVNPDAEDGLRLPMHMVFDSEGRLVVVDTGANQLKLIPKSLL